MINRFARALSIGLAMLVGIAVLLFVAHCAATISADEPRTEWIPYDAAYVGWDMTIPEPEPPVPEPTPIRAPCPPEIRGLATPVGCYNLPPPPTPTPEPIAFLPPTLDMVFDDITLTCTAENDLTITMGDIWTGFGLNDEGPDVWARATWGSERGIGGAETLVIMIGDDYFDAGFGGGVADYTIYNYISSKPPFHYDITLEAYTKQVEGEPIILDKGTPLEREASRGELFYPGEHGIEPVATRTLYHYCDVR